MQKMRALAGVGVAAAMILTAGCGKAAEKIAEEAIENETGGQVDLDENGNVKFESEDGSFEIDADGNAVITDGEGESVYTTGDNAELPEGWPEFLPLPEGSTIMTSHVTTSEGVKTGSVTAEVTGEIKDVHQDFKKALEDEGYEVIADNVMEGSSGDSASLAAEKGEVEVSITVIGGDDTAKPYLQMSVTGI